jgi:hypothetical protein
MVVKNLRRTFSMPFSATQIPVALPTLLSPKFIISSAIAPLDLTKGSQSVLINISPVAFENASFRVLAISILAGYLMSLIEGFSDSPELLLAFYLLSNHKLIFYEKVRLTQ